jgi:glycosyltransferase involved in cell wall biosynthesis
MRPLRIGAFLYHYPQSCGTTFAARGLSRGLAHLGYDVTLYCCGKEDGHSSPEPEQLPNRRVLRFAPRQRGGPFHVPRALLDRIRQNQDQLDLLLIHGNFTPRNVAVVRAARQAGLPYVVCPSGLYHPEVFRKNRFIKAAYGMLFERPMLNGAIAVQVFMDAQVEALARYGVRTPAFVVPNGFEPAEIPQNLPVPAQMRGRTDANPKLLYLGRIDMYTKGLDLLFQAMAKGIREGKLPADLRLDLVGPDWGSQAALIRLAEQLGIAQNVQFFGRVDDLTRWNVMFSSDIMLLTSRHDAFPTTVIEAMAAAKPVILSEETGASSFVRQQRCGFLVKPDAESICAGMVDALAKQAQWVEMGMRGRTFAFDHLVWNKVAQRASVQYDKLLSGRAAKLARPRMVSEQLPVE